MRSAELRVLELVNIWLSLAFLCPSLVVSAATMLTLLAYTSAGNNLSPEQVIEDSLVAKGTEKPAQQRFTYKFR